MLKQPPVFIVGHPRSGTTWTTNLLGGHPNLACGKETHLFNLYLEPFLNQHDKWLDDWISKNELNALLKELCHKIFEKGLERKGKQRLVEKTPAHREWLSEICEFFPGAKIIHMIRDGRDVSLSMLERKKRTGDRWIPDTFEECVVRWANAVKLVKNKAQEENIEILEVVYEDLVQNPEQELQKILTFIDEASESDTIEQMLALNPTSIQSIGRWKNELDESQISFAKQIAEGELGKYLK